MATGARSEQASFASRLREAGATWGEIAGELRRTYQLGPLTACRVAHGWTQREASRQTEEKWPDDPISLDRISSWECWPTKGNAPPLQELVRLAELYVVDLTDLVAGLAEFAHLDAYPASVDRRQFLGRTVAASAALVGARLSPLDTLTRIGASDVARLRTELNDLFAADDAHGGATVYDRSLNQLSYVRGLLDHGRYNDVVGRDLQIVAGEITEMCGWLAYDAGRQQIARQHWTEALTLAQLTDSAQLRTLVMASMALQATSHGSGREAVALADGAQRSARSFGSARLLSLLSAREGLGHARVGDAEASRVALRRAEDLLDETDDPGEAWVSFWSPADFHCLVGSSHLYLEAPRAAELAYRDALAATSPQYPRNRSFYLGRLAAALVAQGHFEEGAAKGSEALDGVCSGRNRAQMQTLRPQLEPHAHHSSVSSFLDRLTIAA